MPGEADTNVPEEARRYLERARPAGAPDALEARIRMRGEIRLKDRWRPFTATHWLAPHRGFEWRATVRMGPVPVYGFDRYWGGRGELRWRLFGLVPMVRAAGADIDRSARGRLAAESVMLPTALSPRHGVAWSRAEGGWLRAEWAVDGVRQEILVELGGDGRPLRVKTMRWADPDGQGWREVPFGAFIEEERDFSGLKIPSRLLAGWWPDTDRYRREGEFFRALIEDVSLP